MFKLDEIEIDFDDEIFNALPKRIKSDNYVDINHGKLSYGIEGSQSNYSSPPNILSHINNDDNIQKCKEHFSNTANISKTLLFKEVPRMSTQHTQFTQSISFSPLTSTQKSPVNKIDCLFDRTNVVSPIRIKPGISSEIRNYIKPGTTQQIGNARKFPGPAGHLPKIGPNEDISKVSLEQLQEHPCKENDQSIASRYDMFPPPGTVTDSSCWQTAVASVGSECWPLFERYCLRNLYKMISEPSGLPNLKVPVACLSLHEVEYLPRDAAGTMVDGTGSIKVAIHRQVLERYKERIKSGSVFILRKVSVFSPSGKRHFLNITEGNVVDVISTQGPSPRPRMPLTLVQALVDECTRPPPPITLGDQSEQGGLQENDLDIDEEMLALMEAPL